MNVSLTPELEAMISEKVRSGLYGSASEVVRASLRLLKDQDELKRIRFEELKRDIQLGIDELDRGEATEYESADALMKDIIAEAGLVEVTRKMDARGE